MPFLQFLHIAGINLALDADLPIAAGEAFEPFLVPECQPDVRVMIRRTECLPGALGPQLYRGDCWRIFMGETGRPIRLFYETPESECPYSASAWDASGQIIRVEYLPAFDYRLAEMRSCFFHIDLEGILIRFRRLYFHASCVETPLGGILFSGPSGIGKSTQAGLWCRYRNARQINGDRPILSFDGERWLAWGSPYAGSSRVYVNDCCPVSAIVMLRQESTRSLRRLSAGEAFRAIWSGLTLHSWDRSFLETASSLAMELAAAVPVYEFGCTPDEAAVAFLEQELGKETNL